MPIEIVPFEQEHLDLFTNFGGQKGAGAYFHKMKELDINGMGDAVSVFSGPSFLGSLGCVPVSEWRAIGWAMLHDVGEPSSFLAIHRGTLAYLDRQPYARIECYVDPTHPEAMRWARLLGFYLETPYKPFFLPDGRGAAEFVRLR